MKKAVSFLLCLVLVFALMLPCRAEESTPAETTNYAAQNYARWAYPVNSYLYVNGSGGLTRVEYADGRVIVEDYDGSFNCLSARSLDMELPIWGGFWAGENYNFLVEGQNNEEEDDAREVIRIIRYDKDWKRTGSASLYGANTFHPFDAGSLRFAEYGDDLYIRTCHEMYTSSDGLNHQASVTIAVRQSDMTITDSWYGVMNISYGYVSHSFNQFLIVDGDGNIVCADHGDAFPRSTVLMKYPTKAGKGVFTADYFNQVTYVDIQEYPGYLGDNTTGGTLGGLAGTSKGYLVAHTCDGAGGGGTQLPYLSFVDKDSFRVTTRALPYQDAACPPMLVPTGEDEGYVLWNQRNDSVHTGWFYYYYDNKGNMIQYSPSPDHGDDTLYYVTYQADGSFGSVQTAPDAPLSDCRPILYRGDVVWYVTDASAPTFYVLNGSGVSAYGIGEGPREAQPEGPQPQPEEPQQEEPQPDEPQPQPEEPRPDEPQSAKPGTGEDGMPFVDVARTDPCYDAVLWAYNHEPRITKGQNETHFAPDATVKRGEAMTFLWRAMGEPEPKWATTPFTDLTAEWYKTPIAWAMGQGVTLGINSTSFSPDATLTTAHIVTFLYRAMNPGRDGWYEEAAAWAEKQGYLEGIDLPIDNDTPCPRGTVVLILYNVLEK